MSTVNGQGQSGMTQYKQQDYRKFLRFWFGLVRNVLDGKQGNRFRRTVVYIDTHAGSGFNSDYNCPGSPVIFCEEAEKADIHYCAYLIEKQATSCRELYQRVQGHNAIIYSGDNQSILPSLLDSIIPSSSLGLLYIDPNGIPDSAIIRQASAHPKMRTIDILIRYNTSAVWRNQHNGYGLDEILDSLQKQYRWAKEFHKLDKVWRWSFLLGMNYPYGDWTKEGWERLDTPSGLDLKDRLADGPNQRQKKHQPPLTGLMEST